MNESQHRFAVAANAPTTGAVLRGPEAPELLRDELLCEIFAATAAAHPDALAMTTLERRFSYREVDDQSSALARGLLSRGAGPDDIIGLWMARGPELLIAQLAIAKTGAAWLPFDADAPAGRVEACLKDAGARHLLTCSAFAKKRMRRSDVETLIDESLSIPDGGRLPTARELGATTDHPAFVIYTSGSSGTPKGVVITGRNICHYLRAANLVYGLDRTDVIFQGASAAFDLSIEETWLSYLVGARLFVATPQVIAETEMLPEVLEEAGVTVLDTVPTLLGVVPRDVKSLRLIILGGEACPPAVAARWARHGRKILNSYGPSETTIVATVAEVRPDAPVTIGKPIPNYSCYVVDEALRLLPRGVEGELLIGGPGVAQGYLNREALTREKFIANPFSSDGHDPVLYRSGDAALVDDTGDLVFRGRIDDQVKIRGFRVELGEIESVLCEQRRVSQAAVALRNDSGVDELVAFLVLDGEAPDRREIRGDLSERLPSYMIPSRFEILEALPRLSSGKIDRSALKRITLTQQAMDFEDQEQPRDEIEAALLAAAKQTLPPGAIAFDADFFTDLGGHSLLAARFVSAVRETPRLAAITLQDLYTLRTLRALARHLEGKAAPEVETRDLSFAPPPLLRRFLCGLAQAVALPFIFAIVTAQWLGVFVSYQLITSSEATLAEEAAALLGVYACVNLLTLLVSIAGKWIVIGRTRPGRYPLWGVYYYRWWLAQRLTNLTASKWFQVSPLMRLYLTALGARIGKDALISDVHMGAIDLISIGQGASLGAKLKLANARVEGNELVIGEIEIGADAHVGACCVIEEDVHIGAGAALEDLSSVPAGARIGVHEIWNGSPARQTGLVDKHALDSPATASPRRRAVFTALFAILSLAIPPLGLLPVFPAFWAFDKIEGAMQLSESQQHLYLALVPLFAWPTAFVLILVTVAFIVAFRWIVLPRLEEGRYSVWSWFFLRKWTVTLANEVALETLSSLFATLYMRGWYRLMGSKIGKDSEISGNLAGRYDLVEIGEKCFIADEAVLGDEDIHRGWIHLKRVKTGDRVFIGNDAVVPPGSEIPDNALIGVKSKPPANTEMSSGDTWFGSPPIKLPVRQTFDAGGSNWTYTPPLRRKALRAVYEAVSISLPTMLFITFGTWAVESFGQTFVDRDYLGFAGLFLLDSTLISLAMTLAVVAVKWLTMGRYEPQVKPMWSFWAMRTESCAVLYWGMAGKVMLEHLRGTPFLPWALRLFGAKVGKGVFLDMVDITEFDCVKIGDYCAVNMQSALQTHLYEDRVMKVGRVELGKGVTVGAGSTVLYDTHVGDFARLGPLTVVMKGEKIPTRSRWIGAPAEPAAPKAEADGPS